MLLLADFLEDLRRQIKNTGSSSFLVTQIFLSCDMKVVFRLHQFFLRHFSEEGEGGIRLIKTHFF